MLASLLHKSTAEKIYEIVKDLPETQQVKILSEVEKLKLMVNARKLDASVKKNVIKLDAIVSESRKARKSIARKYNG